MSHTEQLELLAPPPLATRVKVTKKRIYIVEDEAIAALDLSEWLEDLGYEVCGVADNGGDAVRDIASKKPDLVMMDMHLKGGIDGVDTAAEIMRTQRVAVVFLTAFSDPEIVRRATQVSPYGYLTKPLQPHGLKPAIEVALRLQETEQRLRESERWHAATLRGVADGVIATDAEGLVCFMNPAAERMTGWTMADARGLPSWKVANIHDGQTGKPTRQEGVLREGHVRAGDLLNTKFDEQRRIDHSQSAIRADDGALLGAVSVLRDAVRPVSDEAAIQLSEERFRVTFDASPIGLALVSRDGRFLRTNKALCDMFQLGAADLTHKTEPDLTVAEDRTLTEVQVAKLKPGSRNVVHFAKRYRPSGDTVVPMRVDVALVPHDANSLCYLYQLRPA